MGFEPTRAEHNGLAVHRLNHSATSSSMKGGYKLEYLNYFSKLWLWKQFHKCKKYNNFAESSKQIINAKQLSQSELYPGETEVQIMDYQTQQWKLFPAIAMAFSFHFAGIQFKLEICIWAFEKRDIKTINSS